MDELRGLVPLAFEDDQGRPGEIQQFGVLSEYVPMAFENVQDQPKGFDERADEAGRQIADQLKPRSRFERIRDNISRGVSRVFERQAAEEVAQQGPPPMVDISGAGAMAAQMGLPQPGTMPGTETTGVLVDLARQQAPVQQAGMLDPAAMIAASDTGPQAPPVPPEMLAGAPVPVLDVEAGIAQRPEVLPPEAGPSIAASDPNVAAAAAQDEAFREEINRAFREQELLGSRRLGALKRGRQVATTGLRNAPGMLGALARAAKDDSLTERMIESGMIELTGTERGIELAGFVAPPILEVLATKRIARAVAPNLSGPAASLANLVGRTGAGTRAGGALTGALEGLPTDIAIAIENQDIGEVGLGIGIGAITGLIFPGGGKVADEIVEMARKEPETVAQGLADMLAEARRAGDGEFEQEIEVAMASAMRDGNDQLAKILDDAIERLPTQAEVAARRAEEAAAEAPARAAREEAAGRLPTAAEAAERRLAERTAAARQAELEATRGRLAEQGIETPPVRVEPEAPRPTEPVVETPPREQIAPDATDAEVAAFRAPEVTPATREAPEVAAPSPRGVDQPGAPATPERTQSLIQGAERAARGGDGPPPGMAAAFTDFTPDSPKPVATLDALTDGRAGFVQPDLLRAITAPALGGVIGSTLGGITARDEENAPGRAMAGAVMGILLGAGPGVARALDKNKWVRQMFTPGGALPGSVKDFGEGAADEIRSSLSRTRGQIAEAERIIRNSLADVAAAQGQSRANVLLGGANPFHGMDEATTTAINRFMKGEQTAIRDIPAELREPIGRMRSAVDDYSRAFLKEGIVEGELASTFDARIGAHLTRSYRVFEDPDWAKNAPKVMGEAKWEQVKNTFKSWYRSQFPETSDDQMEVVLEDFLSVGDEMNALRAVQSGKLGRLNTQVLARRKAVPVEIRQLWGEHDDPAVQFARTITNQAGYIANYRFLKEFRDQGLGRGFLFDPKANPSAVRPSGFTAEIAGEGSETMAPLRGLRTTPEIAEAFQRQFTGQRKDDNIFMNVVLGMGTTSKIMKTVASHVTGIRNLLGNNGFAMANGFLFDPVGQRFAGTALAGGAVGAGAGAVAAPEGAELAGAAAGFSAGAVTATTGAARRGLLRDVKIGGLLADAGIRIPGTRGANDIERAYFDRLTRLGVIGNNARATELNAALKSVAASPLGQWARNPVVSQQSGVMRSIRTAATAPLKLYAVEDDVWKVVAFGVERSRYARALGDAVDDAELDQMAADVVRQTWPTYSETPEIVKQLGRIGGFVSFPAEVFRTIHGTLGLIEKEWADPRLRKIAASRIAGLITAGSGASAMAAASRKLYNVTQQEEDAIREFQPEWSENATFVHRQEVGDGKYAVVDASYMDPYSYILRPLQAFMRGEDWRSMANEVVREAAEPWVSANPLFGEVFKAAGDDDMAVLEAIAKSLTPGAADQYLRAFTGRSSTLREVDPQSEVIALAIGLRGDEKDIRESLRIMGGEFNREIRDATASINRAEERGGVTRRLTTQTPEEQFSGVIDKAIDQQVEAYLTLIRKVKAAQVLGLSRQEITAILREARVSRDNINLIMAGVTGDDAR